MMEILNKTCRLCLAVQEEGKELILLKIVEKQKIKFEELTNVELTLNDQHPSNICTDCCDLLENFFFYKQQLIKKQNDLKEFLGKISQQNDESRVSFEGIECLDEILEDQLIGSDGMLTFDDFQVNDIGDELRDEIQYESIEPKLILNPTFFTDATLPENLIIGIENANEEEIQNFSIRQFICNYCGNIYQTRNEMKSHLRSHNLTKRYNCLFEGCDKAFRYKHHLSNHQRIHTQTSPFQCEQCPANFRQKYALTLHKRKHTKSFLECSRCKSQFVMLNQLTKHEKFQCNGTFKPYVIRTKKKVK